MHDRGRLFLVLRHEAITLQTVLLILNRHFCFPAFAQVILADRTPDDSHWILLIVILVKLSASATRCLTPVVPKLGGQLLLILHINLVVLISLCRCLSNSLLMECLLELFEGLGQVLRIGASCGR